MELAATRQRVPRKTPEEYNRKIRQDTEARIWYYAHHPEKIDQRLDALEREWDIERALETNASSLMLATLGLGVLVNRKFMLVSGMIAGFLLQHALQGWCPPVPLFRHLGLRTQPEIESERYSLKLLRGDFGEGEGTAEERAREALRAIGD